MFKINKLSRIFIYRLGKKLVCQQLANFPLKLAPGVYHDPRTGPGAHAHRPCLRGDNGSGARGRAPGAPTRRPARPALPSPGPARDCRGAAHPRRRAGDRTHRTGSGPWWSRASRRSGLPRRPADGTSAGRRPGGRGAEAAGGRGEEKLRAR